MSNGTVGGQNIEEKYSAQIRIKEWKVAKMHIKTS
jgi:hypothetical protein